jgi:nitrogen fixation protein FixH
MTAVAPAPAFRLTGWHVLAGFVAFFAVVIGVDVSFAVMAYRTHPGEVSVTPYEDGLLYNRHEAQMRAQAALGWQAAAAATDRGVLFELRDAAGQPVRGLTVSGKLERPATESGRITPRFAEVAPGRYEARVGRLAGAWDFTADARDAHGRSFTAERRLTWR